MATDIAILARERPLSERTVAERRNLMIAAAAGIAINVASVGELLGFGSHPRNAPNADLAKGAFFLAILYLEVMFLIWALKDMAMWKAARTIADFAALYETLAKFRDGLANMRENPHQGEPPPFEKV